MPWQIFKPRSFAMYHLKVYSGLNGLASETQMLNHEKQGILCLFSRTRKEPIARAHLEGF